MQAISAFDRIYFLISSIITYSAADASQRASLKRKSPSIGRSYCESFALSTSTSSSQVEADKLLLIITNMCFKIAMIVTCCRNG